MKIIWKSIYLGGGHPFPHVLRLNMLQERKLGAVNKVSCYLFCTSIVAVRCLALDVSPSPLAEVAVPLLRVAGS